MFIEGLLCDSLLSIWFGGSSPLGTMDCGVLMLDGNNNETILAATSIELYWALCYSSSLHVWGPLSLTTTRALLLSSFYRWGNWASERVSHLLQFPQAELFNWPECKHVASLLDFCSSGMWQLQGPASRSAQNAENNLHLHPRCLANRNVSSAYSEAPAHRTQECESWGTPQAGGREPQKVVWCSLGTDALPGSSCFGQLVTKPLKTTSVLKMGWREQLWAEGINP